MRGRLDVAIMWTEAGYNLCYQVIGQEPLIVLMPRDHLLALHATVHPREFAGEIFICGAKKAAVFQAVTKKFLNRAGLDIRPDLGVENISMAVSLVASTLGLALMLTYAESQGLVVGCWLPLV